MNEIQLFPFHLYWYAYLFFVIFILLMLFIDLGIFNKKDHVTSAKESLLMSLFWFGLALSFCACLYFFTEYTLKNDLRFTNTPGFFPQLVAKRISLEFLTGLVMEKSLATDNIFVFVLIFNYFRIPKKYQHRVLFYGILGALFFRAIFISLGSFLVQFHFTLYIFGAFLIFSGVKMLTSHDKPKDLSNNWLIKKMQKIVPIDPEIKGHNFFLIKHGKRFATPLFATLILLEFSDIIFAVDSIPAIFAVTKEPLVVFTSNIFAILGLRSLYFLLSLSVDKFHYLKYGLSFILIFVGLKMLVGEKYISANESLLVILFILVVSIFFSLCFPKSSSIGMGKNE